MCDKKGYYSDFQADLVRGHSFSRTYTEFFEKLTFLHFIRNVSFSENFAYVQNE